MTKDKILKELDRIRTAIESPEPDLRDVMAKLGELSDRLEAIERRPPVGTPITYPVYPYPYRPYYGTQIWSSNTTGTAFQISGGMAACGGALNP